MKKFAGCNGEESNRWPLLDRRDQESSRNMTDLTEKLDPQEHREFRSGAGICRCMTEQRFDIAFSAKNQERGSRTDHSLKDEIEENRALPQRTSAMCVEFPLGGKAGRHPKTRCSTSGGVLAIGPCFTFRHWSVTQATVSLSSAESEAKAITKGCNEAMCVKHLLEHQTARPFKIEVWTDSSSARAVMQRLGPGRRAKHLEVQTMWVRQLNKIGVISLNTLNTLENVTDLLTKHIRRAVLDKLAGVMGYTFLDQEAQKFQEYININHNYWIRNWQQLETAGVRRWRERIVGG